VTCTAGPVLPCPVQVMWGVDEAGNLAVTETRPYDPMRARTTSAALSALMPALAAPPPPGAAGTYFPADKEGKAHIPLPGGIMLEVRVGETAVMNPIDGSAYYLTWGRDAASGTEAVTSCVPAGGLGPVGAPATNVTGSAANGGRWPQVPRTNGQPAALPPVAGAAPL
jgi:hypothetical protein